MSNQRDFGCLFDSPTKRYNPRHTTTEAACAVKGSGGETQYAILLTGIVARKTRIFCAGIPSRSGCTAWYMPGSACRPSVVAINVQRLQSFPICNLIECVNFYLSIIVLIKARIEIEIRNECSKAILVIQQGNKQVKKYKSKNSNS